MSKKPREQFRYNWYSATLLSTVIAMCFYPLTTIKQDPYPIVLSIIFFVLCMLVSRMAQWNAYESKRIQLIEEKQ